MNRRKHIAILLLAGIAIFGMILLWPNKEPFYEGHRLSWWVDEYGNHQHSPERIAQGKEALSAIGTNTVPYLVDWIGKIDAEPPFARRSVSIFLNHLPKAAAPHFLVSWADKDDFHTRMWDQAWLSAAAFAALGTNATSYISEIKALAASSTNGNVCVVAECALGNMGPDGIAAAFDVIATPGLRQRDLLVQSSAVGQHLEPPNAMTFPVDEDPNFRINSIRAAPFLLKCLGDQDSRVQRWAVRLLSSSDPTSMVSALTNFLAGSPSPAIRGQAVAALAKHGRDARKAVPFLLSRCSDSDPEIRTEATNALMQIAPEMLSKDYPQSSQPP